MKTLRGKTSSGLVAILGGLFIAACSSSDIDALRRQHADAQALLDQTRAQLDEADQRAQLLDDTQDQVEQLAQRLRELESQRLSDQEQLRQARAQVMEVSSQLKRTEEQLGQAQARLGASRSDLQAALGAAQAWCQFAQDVYYQGLNHVSPVSYSRYPEGTGLGVFDCGSESRRTPTDCSLAQRLNQRTIDTLVFYWNQNRPSPLAVASDQSIQVFSQLQEAIRRACS